MANANKPNFTQQASDMLAPMGLAEIAPVSMNAGRGKGDCRISFSAIFLAGFCNPRPEQLTGRLKLTSKSAMVAASKTQINPLATELR